MTSVGTTRSVLLCSFFPRSLALEGTGSLVKGLARALTSLGWETTMLLPEGAYGNLPDVEVVTYRPGAGGWRRYLRAVRELSESRDAVLLVENNPVLSGAAAVTACPHRTYCMFTTPLQGLSVLRELGLCRQAFLHTVAKSRLLAGILHRWSDRRCIVGSEFQAEQLRRLGVGDVYVMPASGVSKAAVVPSRAQARASLGLPDSPVTGYLGHYSRAKGVDLLVKAFADCELPGVLALAYSRKGALTSTTQPLLARLREEGRLREFEVVDPLAFLAACDVAVFPYVTASVFHQPQALLESFAASTAVVSTDVGGIKHVHRHGETGWLVPPRDTEALAGAVRAAVDGLDETHRMGLAARRTFETESCSEVFCERFIELLAPASSAPGPGLCEQGTPLG